MTPDELFALPVGTRVECWLWGQFGTVAAADAAHVLIRYDDGTELNLPRACEHVAEFAGGMEVVTADEPTVVLG